MKLIAPQRTDIPGYAPPAGPDIHPCALITGFPWPSDHRAANWCYLPRTFAIDRQVSDAERLAKAAPEGARAATPPRCCRFSRTGSAVAGGQTVTATGSSASATYRLSSANGLETAHEPHRS